MKKRIKSKRSFRFSNLMEKENKRFLSGGVFRSFSWTFFASPFVASPFVASFYGHLAVYANHRHLYLSSAVRIDVPPAPRQGYQSTFVYCVRCRLAFPDASTLARCRRCLPPWADQLALQQRPKTWRAAPDPNILNASPDYL